MFYYWIPCWLCHATQSGALNCSCLSVSVVYIRLPLLFLRYWKLAKMVQKNAQKSLPGKMPKNLCQEKCHRISRSVKNCAALRDSVALLGQFKRLLKTFVWLVGPRLPVVWTWRALTRNLLTYLLTYLLVIDHVAVIGLVFSVVFLWFSLVIVTCSLYCVICT